MHKYIGVLKAIGDENRIKILWIISQKNICAKGIARKLDITEAAVSQHLKILKDAGLIKGDKKGYHIIYTIDKDKLIKVKELIDNIINANSIVSFKCTNECKNNRCYYKNIIKEDLKMKIGFPVKENLGMESIPYGHFGTAPMFVICDLEKGEVSTVNNGDLGHEHGHCQPMKALSGTEIDAIVVGGIGRGAINGLNNMGIKVFKATEGTIEDNIKEFKSGNLQEFNPDKSCNHHDCAH